MVDLVLCVCVCVGGEGVEYEFNEIRGCMYVVGVFVLILSRIFLLRTKCGHPLLAISSDQSESTVASGGPLGLVSSEGSHTDLAVGRALFVHGWVP